MVPIRRVFTRPLPSPMSAQFEVSHFDSASLVPKSSKATLTLAS